MSYYKLFVGCLLAGAALFPFASQTRANDYYIGQTAQGTGTGASAANAAACSFFNSQGNWSSTPGSPGQISPGDTVHLEGVISSPLTVQGSGVTGNTITILFDPGASMQAPVWPASTGAIYVSDVSYITIDGGATGTIGGPDGNPALANGFIENTQNGTGLANQTPSNFIRCADSSNIVVRNIGLYNLYVRTSTTDLAPGTGSLRDWSAVTFFYYGRSGMSNILMTNCIVHDAYTGIFSNYEAGSQNFEFSQNSVYNCNWGGICGDANSSATMTGLLVHDNSFSNFANWDDTTGSNKFHHDGFFAWAVSGGTLSSAAMYNNVVGPNFGQYTAGGLFIQGWVSDLLCYDNTFLENANDKANNGLIFLNPYPDIAGAYSVYNNTFVGAGVGIAVNAGPDPVAGHTSRLAQTYTIENNLFTGVGTAIAMYYINSPIAVNGDYNLGYNLNPQQQYTCSSNGVSIFRTLSQWQLLGWDVDGTNANPNLDAAYVPQLPSGAIGAGVNLSQYFSEDADGFSLAAQGPWDIGAYKFLGTPVINSAVSGTVTVNSAFNYTITANNSPVSYGATGLPPGLTVNPVTGVISGVPTQAGTYTVLISASNAGSTGVASITIIVLPPPPVISGGVAATGQFGAVFNYSIAGSNSPTGYGASGLPPGLAVDPVAGVISGVPTAAGIFSVVISASNAGGTGYATLLLTVINPPPPIITSIFHVTVRNGVTFSYAITAGNYPISYNAKGLPAGASVNTATGVISGVVTAAGTYVVVVSASNAAGTGTMNLIMAVNPPAPVITSPPTAAATTGTAFKYAITATNSPASYAASGLPVGLTVNTITGAISGIPTVAGTFGFYVYATNGGGTMSERVTLTVAQAVPVITSLNSAKGIVGSAFSYAITATNSPTSYSASGLPVGLSVNAGTGLISGIPTAAGTFTVTIKASNSGGTGSAAITLTIASS